MNFDYVSTFESHRPPNAKESFVTSVYTYLAWYYPNASFFIDFIYIGKAKNEKYTPLLFTPLLKPEYLLEAYRNKRFNYRKLYGCNSAAQNLASGSCIAPLAFEDYIAYAQP